MQLKRVLEELIGMHEIMVSLKENILPGSFFGRAISQLRGFIYAYKHYTLYSMLVLIYCLSFFVVMAVTGTPLTFSEVFSSLLNSLLVTFATVFFWVMMKCLLDRVLDTENDRPISYLLPEMKDYMKKNAQNVFPMAILFSVFSACFGLYKSKITVLHPFSWDTSLMELDRWLHFGVAPWEVLQPVFGFWGVTYFLNLVYISWFIALSSVLLWMMFEGSKSKIRMQFFISFMLSWSVGGSLMAILFSSAGPVYYGNLDLGSNPYHELMVYLNGLHDYVGLQSVYAQQILWENYQRDNAIALASISAMPSLHNGSAVIFALVAWQYSRKLGIIATIFAVLIFLGSVHLGWHYAVDGYFAFIIAMISWWIGGKIADWYLAIPSIKEDLEKPLS